MPSARLSTASSEKAAAVESAEQAEQSEQPTEETPTTSDKGNNNDDNSNNNNDNNDSNNNKSSSSSSNPTPNKSSPNIWIALGLALFAGGVILRYYEREKKRKLKSARVKVQKYGKPLLGGPFELTGMDGKRVRLSDFAGKYTLLYFGFTHCPDVCPTELEKMAKALDLVDKNKAVDEVVQPIFITVDPRRDTPERLKEYSKHYHERCVWLTGSDEDILQTAKRYRVFYDKPDVTQEDYLVDHSIFFYLVDRHGEFLEFFGKNFNAEEIAEKMSQIIIEDKQADETRAHLEREMVKKAESFAAAGVSSED